jgi:hypothetical protein
MHIMLLAQAAAAAGERLKEAALTPHTASKVAVHAKSSCVLQHTHSSAQRGTTVSMPYVCVKLHTAASSNQCMWQHSTYV